MNRPLILIVLGALLLVGSCGVDGDTADPGPSETDPDARPGGADEALDSLFAGASDYQRNLLEGGVTRREYEAAALEAQSCIEDGGLSTEMTFGTPLITLTIDEEVSIGGGLVGDAPPVVSRCYEEYLEAVETRYLLDNPPSQTDIEAETERFYECLRQRGYPIPENAAQDPSTGDAVDAADYDDLVECWDVAAS